jgi:ribosome-associated protein
MYAKIKQRIWIRSIFAPVNDFSSEIIYKTARSGGKGGQNVNKVETMVEALWQVAQSRFFLPEEKERMAAKLATKMNKDGYLVVKCSETRSQLENKEIAVKKMELLVAKSLTVPKKRKATKPSKAAVAKRLDSKKKEGLKKAMRKPPPGE